MSNLIYLMADVGRWMEESLVDCETVGLHFFEADPRRRTREHLHRGIQVKEGLFLNLRFYGLTRTDLGKKVNFSAVVREREIHGKTYAQVDFYKKSGDPKFMFELNLNQPQARGDVEIANSDAYICFNPVVASELLARKAA